MLETFEDCYLPYCVQKLKSGRWIFLNREYLPLGHLEKNSWDMSPKEYYAYLETKACDIKLNAAWVGRICVDKHENCYWFYLGYLAEKEKPAYLNKIKLLMSKQIKKRD